MAQDFAVQEKPYSGDWPLLQREPFESLEAFEILSQKFHA